MLASGQATFGDVEALPYTRMVIQEAMRLFPPAFSLSRVALADDKVGQHSIRAGSVVSIIPYVTHRNPRLWKDPLRFDPERFTPDRIKTRHRFAYLPFGGGPRICIAGALPWRRRAWCSPPSPALTAYVWRPDTGLKRTAGSPFARATVFP